MKKVLSTIALLLIPAVAAAQESRPITEAYQDEAKRIIDVALANEAAWDRLAYLVDTFGPRFSGTPALEDAIDWMLSEMESDGLENVHGEQVMVPRWVRGEEALTLLAPREDELALLGLGGSVATPPDGITADVLVVGSLDELEQQSSAARGKIVLFNVPFTTYGNTVRYRSNGASWAAQHGAVASLVRSIGPASMYTPHTGNMQYADGVPRIPHAAITLEDAEMMQRMQDRGQRVRVRLEMHAETRPDVPSRNVIAELVGSERPDEIVVIGGHIDSWDVGQGAMDDAGGCVAAWEAVRLLKELGLQPKRTIRVVLWTNEENGLRGATAYRDQHMDELDDHVLAIESDAGVFKPEGFGFGGTDEAYAVMQEIGALLNGIEAGEIRKGGGGADIGPIMREGVPGMGLNVDGSEYFWYHHTEADMLDKLDPHELNLSIAAMAVAAYVAADMPSRLPRRDADASN